MIEDYLEDPLQKEPVISTLIERFKTTTLRKFYQQILLAVYLCFADLLLAEDFEQCTLRKELIIVPFVEWLPTTTLKKHYLDILLALRAICFTNFFFEWTNLLFFVGLGK